MALLPVTGGPVWLAQAKPTTSQTVQNVYRVCARAAGLLKLRANLTQCLVALLAASVVRQPRYAVNDPWSGVNPIRARPRPQGNDNGGRSSARNDVLALGADSLTHLWGRPGLAKHRFELCPGLPWSFWKTSFRFG